MKSRVNTYRVYLHFLYPFFILIAISIVFSIAFMTISNKQVEKLEINKNILELQTSNANVNDEFDRIGILDTQVCDNYEINQALRSNTRYERNYAELHSAIVSLKNIRHISPILSEIILYVPSSELIITSDTANTLDNYYDISFSITGLSKGNFQLYIENLCNEGKIFDSKEITLSSSTIDGKVMASKFTVDSKLVYQIKIIDSTTFSKKLLNSNATSNRMGLEIYSYSGLEFSNIASSNNKTATDLSSLPNASGYYWEKNNLVCYTKDSKYKWVYFSSVPKDRIYIAKNSFLVATLLNVSFLILVSLFLLSRYTKSNVMPAIRILSKSNVKINSTQYFEVMEDVYSTLLEDNLYANEKLALYRDNERQIFEYKLFNSKFEPTDSENNEENETQMQHITDQKFLLFLCYIEPSDKTKDIIIRTNIKNSIRKSFKIISTDSFSYDYDTNLLGVMCYFDNNDIEQCKNSCVQIVREIEQQYSADIFIVVSEEQDKIDNIYQVMDELKKLVRNKRAEFIDGVLIYHNDYFNYTVTYDFTIHTQQQLIRAIVNGEYEESRRIFSKIYVDNILNKNLDVYTSRVFLVELFSIFYKMNVQLSQFDDLYKTFNQLSRQLYSLDELTLIQNIITLAKDLCNRMSIEKQSTREGTTQQIIDLIKENYGNPDFSLIDTVKEMNVSYPYISAQFKKDTTMTLSEYLEKYRIEKAKDMLRGTNKTVVDISNECGYNSSSVFCRAFKKVCKVTPANFRKAIDDDEDDNYNK